MEKNYFGNRYSDKLLSPLISKILFNRVFHRSVLLLLLFYSVGSYSQETAISGLENIHISEGATVIYQDAENNVTVIASSASETSKRRNDRQLERQAPAKHTNILAEKKNAKKAAEQRLIRKIQESAQKIAVYNKSSAPNAYFSSSNDYLNQGITSCSNYTNAFLQAQNGWKVFLRFYQNRATVLYLFYHSQKVENTLFARPPPHLISYQLI